MVVICGWCQRYLGMKEPQERVVVSHGMCPVCAARQRLLKESPTLVVSRSSAPLVPILQALLQGFPPITVTVDRREGERRREAAQDTFLTLNRRASDRRRGVGMALL